MGMAPTSSASATVRTPPPPQPSDRLTCNPQGNAIPLHPRVLIPDAVSADGERGDNGRQWMPKMDFPHFNGDDA
jgi:hypothetical protein